jgi:signal transduction histidine kinase
LSNRSSYSLTRSFGDLKVRPKLIVLHNLFFLVLTCSAYFALIPLFEQQVADARAREVSILGQPQQGTEQAYADAVARAKLTLFLVLGLIYVLEAWIMPRYVYSPLTKMLEADHATQAGDRTRELIPPEQIMEDEIGQIMLSRNDTVSTLRRREDELAAALRKLEEQDRLVSLGLLSASVAHELNTPLAVLNGSLEKLIETSKDAPTLERLARMQRVTRRLRTISESLVDFARVRKQQMEPVTARTVVEEAWGLIALDAKASEVSFTNRVAPEDRVTGNPDKLVQVFVNLLRNAVNAFESPGGEIQVHSRAAVRTGHPGVAITVEDNGPGIPAEVLPNVFDAFVTSRLDANGTGLGLTVAEGIVTQHGGTISAANRPEGGARLEVWLPSATV